MLQQYYFYGIAQVLGVILLCLYFVFGISVVEMSLVQLLKLYIPLIIVQQLFFLWTHRFNINPNKEKGFMWRAKLLNWAVWPIYFMALTSVVINKRLTYAVTPKGKQKNNPAEGLMFLPHFILGTLTTICLVFALFFNRTSPLLLFWAIVNTVMMYGFSLPPLYGYFKSRKRKFKLPIQPKILKTRVSF